MNIIPNKTLAELTTFRIGGKASQFVSVATSAELVEALEYANKNKLEVFILGGGSNLLVSDHGFAGLIIQIALRGKSSVDLGDLVELKVGAGEVWDEVVRHAVDQQLWGLENLSNIPGLTGAIPVQNVGAYGQEASQVIKEVEILDRQNFRISTLTNNECGFAYRQSHFNTDWKNRFVILSVTFSLHKTGRPNLSYVDVKKYFSAGGGSAVGGEKLMPSLNQIREAIIEIRKNKFPDLSLAGCAGSFFKNLLISEEQYQELESNIRKNFTPEIANKLLEIKNKFPQIGGIKIPTGFLVEICGLKGQTVGDARLWEKQALVIVNQGQATASDVGQLFNLVRRTVFSKTGAEIMPEPEFVGFARGELENYFKLT